MPPLSWLQEPLPSWPVHPPHLPRSAHHHRALPLPHVAAMPRAPGLPGRGQTAAEAALEVCSGEVFAQQPPQAQPHPGPGRGSAAGDARVQERAVCGPAYQQAEEEAEGEWRGGRRGQRRRGGRQRREG